MTLSDGQDDCYTHVQISVELSYGLSCEILIENQKEGGTHNECQGGGGGEVGVGRSPYVVSIGSCP